MIQNEGSFYMTSTKTKGRRGWMDAKNGSTIQVIKFD